MRLSRSGRSRPAGLSATRSAVRLQPSRASQTFFSIHPPFAQGFLWRVVVHHVGTDPVGNPRVRDHAHQATELLRRERRGLQDQRGQGLGVEVARGPERQAEFVIGLDRLGQLPDLAGQHAKRVIAGAALLVLSSYFSSPRALRVARATLSVIGVQMGSLNLHRHSTAQSAPAATQLWRLQSAFARRRPGRT